MVNTVVSDEQQQVWDQAFDFGKESPLPCQKPPASIIDGELTGAIIQHQDIGMSMTRKNMRDAFMVQTADDTPVNSQIR